MCQYRIQYSDILLRMKIKAARIDCVKSVLFSETGQIICTSLMLLNEACKDHSQTNVKDRPLDPCVDIACTT